MPKFDYYYTSGIETPSTTSQLGPGPIPWPPNIRKNPNCNENICPNRKTFNVILSLPLVADLLDVSKDEIVELSLYAKEISGVAVKIMWQTETSLDNKLQQQQQQQQQKSRTQNKHKSQREKNHEISLDIEFEKKNQLKGRPVPDLAIFNSLDIKPKFLRQDSIA
ncbi:hypothetical protein HCN44_000334 [Aphidius gifuensis]|uniref:Uncharacterized protein n=1 Tax=Aphidius gifuensis TaxID=684658 RepID=A0A835CPE2_APHGI|nr:hypothetical protein HCN44_000334 [Aphidius gifuensis]